MQIFCTIQKIYGEPEIAKVSLYFSNIIINDVQMIKDYIEGYPKLQQFAKQPTVLLIYKSCDYFQKLSQILSQIILFYKSYNPEILLLLILYLNQMIPTDTQPLIVNFKDNPEPIVMKSLCVNCQDEGETILLLTKIPFFKQIMICSFNCKECGFRNNEVQFVGELPSNGINIVFRVTKPADLSREIVKSENAVILFPDLDLQIPAGRGEITTLEGILLRTEQEISEGQSYRKLTDQDNYNKIEQFLTKLRNIKSGKQLPFNMKLSDPSGNSHIKNPYAPKLDQNLLASYPPRTAQQTDKMGYNQKNSIQKTKQSDDPMKKKDIGNNENAIKVMNFNQSIVQQNFLSYEPAIIEIDCHVCQMPGQLKTCSTSIPYFTDLIIMSFCCQHCGAHTAQTKTSGEGGTQTCTITLKIEDQMDLKRDLFKSDTCKIQIPEIELELDYGTLGGVFTSVQGLLEKIQNHFGELFGFTDSDSDFCVKINEILETITKMRNFEKKFTLILNDPLAHSFLQNPFHPDDDLHAKRQLRQRTEDENDFLGFADMKI